MSLINQMLQDLEKRQSGPDTPALANVRAVPRFRSTPYFWPLLLLLAAAAAALAWELLQPPVSPRPLPALAAVAVSPPPAASPSSKPEPLPEPPTALPVELPQTAVTAVPPSLPPAANAAKPAPAQKESLEPALAAVKPATPPKAEPPLSPPVPTTVPATLVKAPPPLQAMPVVQSISAQTAPAQALTPATVTKQMRELTPQQSAESEYRRALSFIQQGRVTEAMDALSSAVQLDPRHAAARQTLIGLLVEAKRFGDAERRLQEGLNLDRAQPELAMTLARLQVERGDADAAIATLERSQSSAAERADYHAFMAALLQRDGRHPQAIEHYQQALRLSSSAVWQMGLGISLQAENRYREAREAFTRAKAANTLSPELQAFVEQRLKQLGL